MTKKKGLGRGLKALISEPEIENGAVSSVLEVRIEAIQANPLQPRAKINSKGLKALSESIKDKGVLEPLVVRRSGSDQYELIAGERRLRASKAAGLTRVPVIIRDADNVEMLELALIENLHREDLNPVEEAESYRRLAEEFSRTQEEIARIAGKDRSTVANLLRLLGLPSPVLDDVRQGRMTTGHARALLALPGDESILAAREQVLVGGLSVRETEALVKKLNRPQKARKEKPVSDAAYYKSLSENMSRTLGAKVRIVPKGRRRIEISYSSNAELERIMKLLGIKPV